MTAYVVEACRPISNPLVRRWTASCWYPWFDVGTWTDRKLAVEAAEAWEDDGFRARIREVP